MTKTGYTTHCNGSWKWQDRYALNLYEARESDKGIWMWRKVRELDGKIKPGQVGNRMWDRMPLSKTELVLAGIPTERDILETCKDCR